MKKRDFTTAMQQFLRDLKKEHRGEYLEKTIKGIHFICDLGNTPHSFSMGVSMENSLLTELDVIKLMLRIITPESLEMDDYDCVDYSINTKWGDYEYLLITMHLLPIN